MEGKRLIHQCKLLVEKECANYHDRLCLPKDRPCHVINTRYATIHDGAIDCDWFLEAVLPGSAELNRLVWHELLNETVQPVSGTRKCERCGEPYVPASPRQKYCVPCGKAVRKRQNREKQRRHTARLREERLKT